MQQVGKLNSSGCSRGNPGESGGGRDAPMFGGKVSFGVLMFLWRDDEFTGGIESAYLWC